MIKFTSRHGYTDQFINIDKTKAFCTVTYLKGLHFDNKLFKDKSALRLLKSIQLEQQKKLKSNF